MLSVIAPDKTIVLITGVKTRRQINPPRLCPCNPILFCPIDFTKEIADFKSSI